MEKQKRIWLNIVIVFVILLSLITIVGSMNDIQEVIALMGSIHLGYFSVAVLFSLVSFFIMSFSSQTVLTALNKKVPYYTGFLIQVVEPFFNGITPFSSGAQPFQLYYYHKHQVEANQSTSVLVVNFILFQIISVLLATIGILIFFNDIIRALGSYTIYLFIGYSINLIILIGLFLLAYVKSVYRLFEKMFAFFERFKWTKKRATILKNKTFNFVEKVQVGIQFSFTKKRVFIASFLLKLVSIALTYASTIFIVRSLGFTFDVNQYVYMIFSGIIAVTTMMFIPLPGASGGTEATFTGLMSILFIQQSVILPAVTIMLLWRVITYYLGMFYGLIGYLLLRKREVKG